MGIGNPYGTYGFGLTIRIGLYVRVFLVFPSPFLGVLEKVRVQKENRRIENKEAQ